MTLFQLNVLLWLTQPLAEASAITPLLYQRGFSVYAISPALTVPLDLQTAAQQAQIAMKSNGRPDVVLTQASERKFAFVECKGSSFGTQSDTAEQTRAFLLIAGARAPEVLGLATTQVMESMLGYLIPESQRADFYGTLAALQGELSSRNLPAGNFSILGLQAGDIALSVTIKDDGSSFFSLPSGSHPIMGLQPDTDPRPLYFIPYDPDLKASEQERLFSKRLLFERLHSAVLVTVGRGSPPAELTLATARLLNDAMFGMYDLWENRGSARHMRGLCRQLVRAIARVVNGDVPETFTEDQTGWKISIPDADRHRRVIDALSRFSCETMDLRAQPQGELFDEQ